MAVLFFLFVYVNTNIESAKMSELNLNFNFESGFYSEDIIVKIYPDSYVPKNSKIYYTLDGNDPDINSYLYEDGILIKLSGEEKVYPVKAVLECNGKYSKVSESVYVLGSDIFTRYNMDVAVLTCDEDDLYDYYNGILVPGYTYDKSISEGASQDDRIGNYYQEGEEWVKQGALTVFTKDGTTILQQGVGISIAGAMSRTFDVKSFQVSALNDDKFELDIFEKYKDISNLSFVNTYNNLKLRSGSTDMQNGNVRAQLAERLISESGFPGYYCSEKCVLYLNGAFYGIFDIQQTFGRAYLKRRFNLPDTDGIRTYGNSESLVLEGLELRDLFLKDLNVESNRRELESKVDMDSFLQMYAIAVLMNHTDWPHNNYLAWRYEGDFIDSMPYTDGKLRFLLKDFDDTFSERQAHEGEFEYIMNPDVSVFSNVMKSDYYRNRFLVILSDFEKNTFNSENVNALVDELYEPVFLEMSNHYSSSDIEKAIVASNEIKDYNVIARELLYKNIESDFDVSEKYLFELDVPEGAVASWNNVIVSGELYATEYYKGAVPDIRIEANKGYSIESVIVNGIQHLDDNLNISDLIDGNEDVSIKIHVRREETPCLVINSVSVDNGFDEVCLYNAGDVNVDLSDYYLSDNYKVLDKFQLPADTLAPGEMISFYDKKTFLKDRRYIFGFSLKEGEELVLYNADKDEIIDTIIIPEMAENEKYGRMMQVNTGNHLVYCRY